MKRPGSPRDAALKFRPWVELSTAARHLSDVFEGEITPADIIRFGIDRQLTLSVNFVNGTLAWPARIVPIAEGSRRSDGRLVDLEIGGEAIVATAINEKEGVVAHGSEIVLRDVFDLVMIGAERWEAERFYQHLMSGPEVALTGTDISLVRAPAGQVFQLCERLEIDRHPDEPGFPQPDVYHHPAGFPEATVVVVRTQELREFEQRVAREHRSDTGGSDHLPEKRRKSYQKVIAGLYARAKLPRRAAAKTIASHVHELGMKVDDDTVRSILDEVEAQLEISLDRPQ